MAYLLDTNIIIDILQGKLSIVSNYQQLSKMHIPTGITTYTIAELYEGFNKPTASKKIKGQEKILEIILDKFEKDNRIFSLNRNQAISYAKFKINLDEKGTPIPIIDLLIGTIAIYNKFTLVTTDENHFKKLKDSVKTVSQNLINTYKFL